VSKKQKKQAYRTTMPFDGGLSPPTERSVMPFHNVHTIQDVLSGKPYKMPAAGGSWSQDDIGTKNRGERGEVGENYKRKERDLEILNRMNINDKEQEKWRVRVPGGVKEFTSFELANKYKERMKAKGIPFSYVTRIAQNGNKQKVIADSINKTFTVESFDLGSDVKEIGSGFCVYPNHIVTCAHVLHEYDKTHIGQANISTWQNNSSNLTIYVTGNRQRKQAELVAFDLSLDIAILRADIQSEPFVLDNETNIGDTIFSVGSPYGFENNVSTGTLGSVERVVYTYPSAPRFMFFDMSVFEGNSGGPVIQESTGNVIGMIVLVVAKSGEYGLNAGLDAQDIKNFCIMHIDGFK
jgi:S1-C subfamily serine protease